MPTKQRSADLRWDGLSQIVAVSLTLFLGIFVAATMSGWFTFAGALFGVIVVALLQRIPYWRLVAKLSAEGSGAPSWRNTLGTAPRRVLMSISTWILGARQGTVNRKYLADLFGFHGCLSRIVRRDLPEAYNVMLFSAVTQSPVYYLRWGVVGWMMGVIVEGVINHRTGGLSALQELGSKIPLELDVTVGLLIALSAIRDAMTSNSRRARRQAENHLPEAIKAELIKPRIIPEKTEIESEGILADFRRETEEGRFRIGRFFSSGVVLGENVLGLIIVSGVLFLVHWLAAFIGVAAMCLTILIVARNIREQREDEEPLYRLRARRASLYRIATHPDAEPLRESVARPGTYQASLRALDEEIQSIVNRAEDDERSRRNVARLVFFTLFGLSALYPLYAAWSGELQPRLALLFIFSMIGLWIGLSSAIERSYSLGEGFDQLAEVREALELLEKEQGAQSHAGNNNGGTLPTIKNSQFEFLDVTCAPLPFAPNVLHWPPVLTKRPIIPATCTIDHEVKVIGPPRSGRSLLLRLMTGHVDPTSGEVLVGGVSLKAVGLAERRNKLLLVTECPATFPQTARVLELFESFCGKQVDKNLVRDILRRFYLLEDFEAMGRGEYKGENLLIEWRSNRLTDQQRKLLWLALNYGAILVRKDDREFRPVVIAVDGVHKIEGRKVRDEILDLYRIIANDKCAKFVCVVRDGRELVDTDWVLALVPPHALPPDWEVEGDSANLVAGGNHKRRFGTRDDPKAEEYRKYLRSLREDA